MSDPFAKYRDEAWPHKFKVVLFIEELHGGTPRNPDVVRSWLKAKAGWTDEMQIQAEVNRIFRRDPNQTDEEVADAAIEARANRHVNGFKRDENGLYVEGRQLKAAIKEAASIARAVNKLDKRWGETGKGVISFVAEHIQVLDDRIYLNRAEHDELQTRFVQSRYGSGITVEEACFKVELTATIASDYKFSDREWAMIWTTGELQGFGASRSQGYGRYVVVTWESLP